MKKTGACLVVCGLVSSAVAQTNAPFMAAQMNAVVPRSLSLQDCIAEAIRHNFDVRVERFEPLKAELSLDGAYAGYDPTYNVSGLHTYNESGGAFEDGLIHPAQISDQNSFNSSLVGVLPTGFQYTISGNVAETYGSSGGIPFDSTSGNIGINMVQPLLRNFWIDGTRLAITAAKNQVKQTEQGLRSQLITTVTAVENAYFELIYAREFVVVQEQALDLAQTQLDQDKQRVQVGSLAPLDVQQDEAQVEQSKASLISAQLTLGTDQRVLKNLITDEYSAWLYAEIQPTMTLEAPLQPFDLQDSWSKGMSQRPDLLQARLSLEQEGIQLKYDRNQLFPELDLVGSYGYNGEGKEFSDAFAQYYDHDRPFYTYGAQLSVPLSNIKARSTYKSDKAVEQQLLLKLKQLEQNIMVQIDDAVGVARSDYQSVLATKQARIYAEAALDAEQKKYAVGKSTTFTVLQLQNTLTTDRGAEIRALANYQEALTSLAQQEGSTLQRRDVDLTVQ